VVARQGVTEVADEIRFQYQTETWGKPASLALEVAGREGTMVTLRARLLDAQGIPCLDARNVVRFAAAGDGELIENLGTVTGSRQLELANGRASIRLRLTGVRAVASVSAAGVASGLCTI
jgi:beta-galactosidase